MPILPGYMFPFQHYKPYTYHHTPPQEPHACKKDFLPPHSPPKNQDPVWLDIFGIKLYFDDVLLLSLLFFLYKEEVKDEGLFLALVLLLIS